MAEDELVRTLTSLREQPVRVDGIPDNTMVSLNRILLNAPVDPDIDAAHWYCRRAASDVTREAAVFLIRLHAYANNARVSEWKARLSNTIHSCIDCLSAYLEAKSSSRTTYFGAFAPATLDEFYTESVNPWEASIVGTALEYANIQEDGTGAPLDAAHPAVVYHALSNLGAFQDTRITNMIVNNVPARPIVAMRGLPIPAAFLFLPLSERKEAREWFKLQYGSTEIPKTHWSSDHRSGLKAIVSSLSSSNVQNLSEYEKSLRRLVSSLANEKLWLYVPAVFKIIPADAFTADTRRLLVNHLHDVGAHFPGVIRSFSHLLKKMGEQMWAREDSQYPLVVFNAMKDNTSFVGMLEAARGIKNAQWFLGFFQDFIETTWHASVFPDIIARIAGFLCEELQHDRFTNARPVAMAAVLQCFTYVVQRTTRGSSDIHCEAVFRAANIHAQVFASAAFDIHRNDEAWVHVKPIARRFLTVILSCSIDEVDESVLKLSRLTRSKWDGVRDAQLPNPVGLDALWKAVYSAIHPADPEGIKVVLAVLARADQNVPVASKTFKPPVTPQSQDPSSPYYLSEERSKALTQLVQKLNSSMNTAKDGFEDMVSRFTNRTISTAIQSLLRDHKDVGHLIALVLNPVEKVQSAALLLVGSAFDVDVRQDCIRTLLEHHPVATIDGLVDTMGKFVKHTSQVIEACAASQALVRCLTDVLEILCAGSDALLMRDGYTRTLRVNLPRLWTLMTESLLVIFRCTQAWSSYVQSSFMTPWMRDALIFGRDLLAQRRVFEGAALAQDEDDMITVESSPSKLSKAGKKMVGDLRGVLRELTSWLRLSDTELLHQSFQLLLTLLECFRQTRTLPSEDTLDKLKRLVKRSRDDKGREEPKHTLLDVSRIAKLAEALHLVDPSDEDLRMKDDSDVEIVEYRPAKSITTELTKQNKDLKLGDLNSVGPKPPSRASVPAVKPVLAPNAAKPTRNYIQTSSTPKSITSTSSTYWSKPMLPATKPSTSPFLTQTKRTLDPKPSSAPKARKLEVSPSSSSEDSSDDEGSIKGSTLNALAKLQSMDVNGITIKKQERRTVKMLDLNTGQAPRAPLTDRRINVDDPRYATLRLRPSLVPLHREILSWSYDHDGPEPPGFIADLVRVPDCFDAYREYTHIFHPLLIHECWSQLARSKEESPEIRRGTIGQITYTDEWLETSITVDEPKEWRLSDTDIVLLRHSDIKVFVLAKVQACKQRGNSLDASLRINASRNPGLKIASKWLISKVFSLSTIHREYAALLALQYYDLCSNVLESRITPPRPQPEHRIQRAMRNHRLNEPQANAILNSMEVSGFGLIQGPPGTGKTSTICGLVGSFLTDRDGSTKPVNSKTSYIPKILLCAPSNAAIDEVAKRLKEGVWDGNGRRQVPRVVRIGAEQAVNVSVKDIALDQLVDEELRKESKDFDGGSQSSLSALRTEIESIKTERQTKQNLLASLSDNAERSFALEAELKELSRRRMALSQKYDRVKDQQTSDRRAKDAARRKYRMQVLSKADVICSTLSGAGHDSLEQFDFEMVIIDEASQAVELSSLIPLKYRCKRCIMVGDPEQLPPTVISPAAASYLYDQSLFVRLQKRQPDAVQLLSIQYRMHPQISVLPSRLFYQNRLKDGPDMDKKTVQSWHEDQLMGPYRFFNVENGVEAVSDIGHSFYNEEEVLLAAALFDRLRCYFPKVDFDYRVGVIAMYRAQIQRLKHEFRRRFGSDIVGKVDFNTVDGFQGQEKDIIILSCVRAAPGSTQIGFLKDARRLNVAFTRSRSSLFILGNIATLSRSNGMWREIQDDAKERGLLTPMNAARLASKKRSLPPDVNTMATTKPAISTSPPKAVGQYSVAKAPSDLKTPKELAAARKRTVSGSAIEHAGSKTASATSGSPYFTATSISAPKALNSNTISPTSGSSSSASKKRPNEEDGVKRPPPALRDANPGANVTAHPVPGSSADAGTSATTQDATTSAPKPPMVQRKPKPKAGGSAFLPKTKQRQQ